MTRELHRAQLQEVGGLLIGGVKSENSTAKAESPGATDPQSFSRRADEESSASMDRFEIMSDLEFMDVCRKLNESTSAADVSRRLVFDQKLT